MNINEMTPEQIFLAESIIQEAEKSGINPNFALKLLFQESQFSPAAMGDNPEEVRDNIRTSLEMLKDLRESVGDDPVKIAAGFFAGGSGARFAETQDINDLPPEAIFNAESFIQSFGKNMPSVFAAPSAHEAFGPASPEPGLGDMPPPKPEIISDADVEAERRTGQVLGGIAGGALTTGRLAKDVVRGFPQAPVQPPAPPTAAGTMRTAPPTPAGALPGPGQVQANTPGQRWAQAVTGVVRPGTESVVEAASDYRRAMPSGKVSKPLAQKYGIGAPLDIGRIAAQNAPPAQGGLQAVTNMFQRMAQSPLGQAATATGRGAARYALPPVALASGLGEALGGYREFQKEKPDYVDVGLSGLGALGAGLSLFPATAPIGLPLAVGAPLFRQALKRGAEPPPPSMDLMAP
jgi:hypothetical protein